MAEELTEGTIGVQENTASSAKKLDTTVVEQDDSGTDVHRESVGISDPTEALNRAGVDEDDQVKEEYALRTTDVLMTQLLDAIELQTIILKRIEWHLALASGEELEKDVL